MNLVRWRLLHYSMYIKKVKGRKDLNVLCYFLRLYFYMIRICMEMVVKNIQMQMCLMRVLHVVVRQCIPIGSVLQGMGMCLKCIKNMVEW